MADLTLWKQKELRQLRAEMDRMVIDFFRDFGGSLFDEVYGEMLPADISEEGDSVIITAELPGVAAADLDVAASPDSLMISGKKEAREGATGRVERRTSFSNRIKLPCRIDPDRVEAEFDQHRLKIILPKCRALNFKKIAVRSAEK